MTTKTQNPADIVLEKLNKQAEKQTFGFIPSIGPKKGKIVVSIIRKYKPKTILEIGTLYGYSAILMAKELPKEGKVITLEVNHITAFRAKRNIKDAGLSEKIEVIIGNATHTIPELTYKFDLLFIDATKNEYLQYLQLTELKLKKGAIVIADNVGIFEENMRDYLEYVRNSGKYISETKEILLEYHKTQMDAMEISIKQF